MSARLSCTHTHTEKERQSTYALMKFRISPTVCVRFILATMRVPSASRICTLVVGFVWSTSNRVPNASAPRPLPPALALPLPLAPLPLGNEPGIAVGSGVEEPEGREEMGAEGEPRRWPWPEKTFAWRARGEGT